MVINIIFKLCYDTCQEKELQQWNSFVKGVGLRPVGNYFLLCVKTFDW